MTVDYDSEAELKRKERAASAATASALGDSDGDGTKTKSSDESLIDVKEEKFEAEYSVEPLEIQFTVFDANSDGQHEVIGTATYQAPIVQSEVQHADEIDLPLSLKVTTNRTGHPTTEVIPGAGILKVGITTGFAKQIKGDEETQKMKRTKDDFWRDVEEAERAMRDGTNTDQILMNEWRKKSINHLGIGYVGLHLLYHAYVD